MRNGAMTTKSSVLVAWTKIFGVTLDFSLSATSPFFLFCVKFYSLLAALGLHCCAQAFSSCGGQGLLLLQCSGFSLQRLLLLQSTGSRAGRLSRCEAQALEHELSSCGVQA